MTLPAVSLIQSMLADTKVSPSHATPRIQIQALIPALKVLELRMASVSTLHRMVVSVATLNMMIKIALVVFISGFSTRPRLGLLTIA
ncbi:Uncharacterised protein [Salmonella enterica subsp. enterica serovar Bovismorbificans]|uniref:Uncharacterized protein n=2 Tax=Salmonella enterica I TaxID=59201 RepID=A0A655DZY2_SALET|nr:Uncharacterised protein [Salmonella enterica subsp. enterica serovar Bovismorbificans]